MGQASFQVRAPGGYSQLVARKLTQKSLQRASCDSCIKIATQHGLEPSIKILTGLDAENQSLPRQKNGGNSVWMVLLCFFSPARVSEIQNMETIISRIVAKDMSWFTLNLGNIPKKRASLLDLGYPTSAALNDSEAPASSATKLWAPSKVRIFKFESHQQIVFGTSDEASPSGTGNLSPPVRSFPRATPVQPNCSKA